MITSAHRSLVFHCIDVLLRNHLPAEEHWVVSSIFYYKQNYNKDAKNSLIQVLLEM